MQICKRRRRKKALKETSLIWRNNSKLGFKVGYRLILVKRFEDVLFLEAAEDDEVMRRLSIRRDTMALIQRRGSTFHQTEQRRRSSVAHSRATSFSASSGRGSIMYDVNVYDNNGYDGNNDYDDDDFTPRNRSRASVSFIQDDDSRSQESTL